MIIRMLSTVGRVAPSASLGRVTSGRLSVGEFAFPGPLRDQLVAAILAGAKTTTSGLLIGYEHDAEPLPRPGDRWVVIDSAGEPVTLVEVVAVRVISDERLDLPALLRQARNA